MAGMGEFLSIEYSWRRRLERLSEIARQGRKRTLAGCRFRERESVALDIAKALNGRSEIFCNGTAN
jgi:hypothetical protein